MATARTNQSTGAREFLKVTHADGTVVASVKRGGVIVATTLTLDELTALMNSEPVAGKKVRSITLERTANIERIIDDATAILEVSEVKPDGNAYPSATTKAAYDKLIKAAELTGSVKVTEYKTAGKVVLTGIVTEDSDDDSDDDDSDDASDDS